MERVNGIMSRAVQRRQQVEQRFRQQTASHRPVQGRDQQAEPSQPLPRRPLPEQVAHLPLHQQQHPASVQTPRSHLPYSQGERLGEKLPPLQQTTRPLSAYSQQNLSGHRAANSDFYPEETQEHRSSAQSAFPTQSAYTPPSLPESAYRSRTPSSTRLTHTDVDAYPPPTSADVKEEWEEDTADMRYGDWENDGDNPNDTYAREYSSHPQTRGVFEPASMRNSGTKSNNSLGTQKLPMVHVYRDHDRDHAESAAQLLRQLPDRETQVSTAQPPTPQASAQPVQAIQAVRPYQRDTQPLHPHGAIGANHDSSQGAQNTSYRQSLIPHVVRDEQVSVYRPFSTPREVCPKCDGAGYVRSNVPFGHPNFGKPLPCICKEAEQKEKRRQQLRTMSNLDAFHNKSFRNFNPRIAGIQRAFQAAIDYAQNPDGWLLLIGPNGCGKTHLAAAIANLSLEGGSLVLFATVPDLLDHLRAAFAPSSNEVYDQLFARMREAELLVLDDLGAQQSSPWANEKLFQLLNYRYNSRFPTVITANKKGLDGIDERIRSRMADVSLVNAITFEGASDYRPRNPRRD